MGKVRMGTEMTFGEWLMGEWSGDRIRGVIERLIWDVSYRLDIEAHVEADSGKEEEEEMKK